MNAEIPPPPAARHPDLLLAALREGVDVIGSYVALGDSFTAGTGCPPGARWADRVAQALRGIDAGLVYRNYAEKGATTTRLLEHQVPKALQLEPELLTVICGVNDVLESVRPDVPAAIARLAESFDRLREGMPGALLISATLPEQWRFLPLGARTKRRVGEGVGELNERIRELAAERDIPLLEAAGHPELGDRENFSADGLHPSVAGHRKAAEEFIRLIAAQMAPDRGGEGAA